MSRRDPASAGRRLAPLIVALSLSVALPDASATQPVEASGLAAPPPVTAPMPHPGNGKMYIGTYRNILVIDEATSTIEAEIDLRSGMPRSMVLTPDQGRFYVLNTMYETIEVVDIASRRSVDQFTLSSGNRQVRIWGYTVDPQERYAVLLVKTYDRSPDRFEVSRPVLLRYDLQRRTVTDTIPWPGGEARENARMIFSPAGDLLYFFTDEILVFDTSTFEQVDSWRYEEALGEGVGRFEFGFPDQAFEQPGYYTGLFRITDPIQNRRLMGVARVNLSERDVTFFTLGPAEGVSFVIAPGGRKAYGIQQQVGNYSFWSFDLEDQRVERRHRFAGRPRMSLMTSSSGEVLYVYNAGNTIDLYEASTFRYLSTIDLNVDSSTGLFVLP